jgi:hypothetical protein
VLFFVGIEMGTGGLEVRRLAFADRVDVKGVLARGDCCQVEAD